MSIFTEEIKKQIISLYEEGKMDSEIAKIVGIKRATICYFRKKQGLITKFTYSKISKISKEELLPLFEAGLSDYAIAKKLNVSARSVYSYRKAHNITREKDLRFNKNIEPTNYQKQVLLGTLLGDSSLCKYKDTRNAWFSCAHGIKQKEYAFHLCALLESLGAKCNYHKRNIPDKRNNKYYEDYTVTTPCNPALNSWYKYFYTNNKKCIPFELFEYFTEVSLAFMFMDDGSKIAQSYTIATNCFDKEEIKKFQKFLLDTFNIVTSLHKQNRLYINKKSRKHFESLISPYIIDCMKYKLHVS